MKQLQKVKTDIASLDSAAEMAGYFNGLHAAAIMFCHQNLPEEVYKTKDGESDITICGMVSFLDSEI